MWAALEFALGHICFLYSFTKPIASGVLFCSPFFVCWGPCSPANSGCCQTCAFFLVLFFISFQHCFEFPDAIGLVETQAATFCRPPPKKSGGHVKNGFRSPPPFCFRSFLGVSGACEDFPLSPGVPSSPGNYSTSLRCCLPSVWARSFSGFVISNFFFFPLFAL